MKREEILDLIPAYALDALDKDERSEVDTLLVNDAEAQQLLAEYEAVAAALMFHVPERTAPSHLRADLKAKLAQRKLDSNSIPQEPSVDIQPQSIDLDKKVTQFPRRLWVTLAAALFVIAIGFIAFLNSVQTSQDQALYNQLIKANDTMQYRVIPDIAEDASGELLVSASNTEAVLRVASLPDTTSDESYQLWLITEEEIHSGGLFYWETGHGPYYISIPSDLINDIVAVGMSVEPFDGSPLGNAPSGIHLFSVDVASG